MWYVVAAVVIAALAFWYYAGKGNMNTQNLGTQNPSDNSAAAINADFNSTPDGSTALASDQSASAQAVSSF